MSNPSIISSRLTRDCWS